MLKHSKEIQKNLDQVKRYSPEFTLQKFNNYDNSAKQQTRLGFETKALLTDMFAFTGPDANLVASYSFADCPGYAAN